MRRDVAEATIKPAPCRIPAAQAGEPDVTTRHEPHPVMTATPEPPGRQVPHVVNERTAVPGGVAARRRRHLRVHRDREPRRPVSLPPDLQPTPPPSRDH